LSVAAVNTASSTVVSGQAEAVAELVERLQKRGVYARRINVDYASHHAQMDPLLPDLEAGFANLTPTRARIPLYSTVTGQVLEGPELDGGYWCRNLREPVRFDRALQRLLDDGHTVFVEVSAHPVLAMPLTDACTAQGGVVVGSLARNRGDRAQLLRNAGLLHVHGHQLDWDRLLPQDGGSVAELPTYPFQRERYWLEVRRPTGDARSIGLEVSEHPWLGAVTATASDEGYLFTGRLSLADQSWLAEHAVFGTVLVPGTGLLELALTAAHHIGADRVAELTLLEPLVLTEDTPVRLQVVVGAETGDGQREITIYSRPENAPGDTPWRRHATGRLAETTDSDIPQAFVELDRWPVAGAEQVELEGFYEAFAARGLGYGPAFQGLVELWRKDNTAYGRVRLPEGLTTEGFGIHPALLDAALHTLIGARHEEDGKHEQFVYLPFEWTDVELFTTNTTELQVHIELDDTQTNARVRVTDPDGRPVLQAQGLAIREATPEQVRAGESVDHLYRVEFRTPRLLQEEATPAAGTWVLGDNAGLSSILEADHVADVDALLAHLEDGRKAPARLAVDTTTAGAAGTPAGGDEDISGAAQELTASALRTLQRLLNEPRLEATELVWITRSAVGADDDVRDLAHAPLWGLLRAARSEHPERVIRLIDLGNSSADEALLPRAIAVVDEPEIAIRDGEIRTARLVRITRARMAPASMSGQSPAHTTDDHSAEAEKQLPVAAPLSPEGTVLVTG
ncbi:acyltransferase domain-containing protein, partial [Streptomyces thermovulgaris]|uniref:acyltransferase domain-containing protein n=1 Tax=Streptomyces thermovulgaris TaxID=1934 RepID=UPI00117CBEC5